MAESKRSHHKRQEHHKCCCPEDHHNSPSHVVSNNDVNNTADDNDNDAEDDTATQNQGGGVQQNAQVQTGGDHRHSKLLHKIVEPRGPIPVIDLKNQLASLTIGQQQQQQAASSSSAARTIEEAKARKYHFWETQPVPQFSEHVTECSPVELDKDTNAIRKEPYTLPPGFLWENVDIDDPKQLQELYQLLNENYVEDDDNMFRFDYSPEFLKWALQPPGWQREWHCGVWTEKSKKLIGFIGAIPSKIRIFEAEKKMVEINFLCVIKKLRAKKVAPVLIKEITRRVNLKGIFQAVYTAGVVLPKPICTSRYWHRSLNPKKLIDVKFSHLGKNMTLQRTMKLYKLPTEHSLRGFRPLTAADLPQVNRLINTYLAKFKLAPHFDAEECAHWFLPRENVISSFVVEVNNKVTDFVSFYTLPSTVVDHPIHKGIKAAYSFYNASSSTSLTDLINEVLIEAKNHNYDVFNALDLMENKEFLEKLKFGIGDGNLQYYLFNWRCPELSADEIGLVLQ